MIDFCMPVAYAPSKHVIQIPYSFYFYFLKERNKKQIQGGVH